MSKILVTGASGFVGKALIKHLSQGGHLVRALTRKKIAIPYATESLMISSIHPSLNWAELLNGCNVVVHLLARVHIMNDKVIAPLREFRYVNVELTIALAKEAAKQGIKRFIFLSSVKVNGESTFNEPFNESDLPNPQDPYAISKWEAEEALRKISKDTGMEVVIIRSPLIYGPGVRANFLKMMRFVKRGIPLPLGAIQNKRSMIGIDNLVDFIGTVISHPKAANQTFLISDDNDISTTDLLRRIGEYSGKSALLIPISPKILSLLFKVLGRQEFADRLLGSLEIDISKAKKLLGWSPPVKFNEGLKAAIIP